MNRFVFRNSARNSPIDGYRSAGFFFNIRSRIASASGVTFGLKNDGNGAGSETCRTSRSCGLDPLNGGSPARISNSVIPRLYISVWNDTGRRRICSGDMYVRVPWIGGFFPSHFANNDGGLHVSEKSISRTSPPRVARILSGLISRWIHPFWCMCSRANAVNSMIRWHRCCIAPTSEYSNCLMLGDVNSSMMKKPRPFFTYSSTYFRMFGCPREEPTAYSCFRLAT